MGCSGTSYTLLITEKPSAAKRIAEALNDEKSPVKYEKYGVPYYDIVRNGGELE